MNQHEFSMARSQVYSPCVIFETWRESFRLRVREDLAKKKLVPAVNQEERKERRTSVNGGSGEQSIRSQMWPSIHHGVALSHPFQIFHQFKETGVGDLDLVNVNGGQRETSSIQ